MPHPTSTSDANPIASFLSNVALAPRQAHKALTVWPLVWTRKGPPPGPAYVPLREALERGDVRVDELDEGGSVPHVRLTNRGKQPVLFLFGEEILGAKQNRVANASFLVPGRSEVVLDVSCVEAGRWGARRSAGFSASDQVLSHAMREKMARNVRRARAAGKGFDADQGDVWAEIDERIGYARVASDTRAWSDYRSSRDSDLEELDRAFQPVEGQVGFVATIGHDVVGLEAVGRRDVFRASFRALLRSYTIDAVDAALVERIARPRRHRARFDAPEPFVEALAAAPVSWGTSPGLGSDLRVESAHVEACALACEGLVHLTAFPAEL